MSVHPVLEIDGLAIQARSHLRDTRPVTDVSLTVDAGGSLAIVGESGSGKSLTLKAILGLLPPGLAVCGGEIRFGDGSAAAVQTPVEKLRGRGLAFIPQEPMTAMNPTMRLADLIGAGPRATRNLSKSDARALAIDLLREVGISDPERRADAWPHELSGGMRQRAMIAMALATEPQILLCDEPTTALDVTVQDQIVRLLDRIRTERGLALVFVTHDLGLAARLCDRVAVMYAGRVIETGPIASVYSTPAHRYTTALLEAVPDADRSDQHLATIAGHPPEPVDFVASCRFAPRCPTRRDDCEQTGHTVRRLTTTRTTACLHPPPPWEDS